MKINTAFSFAILVYLALSAITETHSGLMPFFKIGAAMAAWQFMRSFLADLRSSSV
mgnify:CR=1